MFPMLFLFSPSAFEPEGETYRKKAIFYLIIAVLWGFGGLSLMWLPYY